MIYQADTNDALLAQATQDEQIVRNQWTSLSIFISFTENIDISLWSQSRLTKD